MANLNALKKLSPQERLKRLREIEEQDKKELEEAQKLIKETEKEIKTPRKEIEAPPVTEVDITRLFEAEPTLETSVEGKAPEGIEESAVKYESYHPDYQIEEIKTEIAPPKVEDSIKYVRESEQANITTSSKQIIKDIKKYQAG